MTCLNVMTSPRYITGFDVWLEKVVLGITDKSSKHSKSPEESLITDRSGQSAIKLTKLAK
jgi:hypothetical protein